MKILTLSMNMNKNLLKKLVKLIVLLCVVFLTLKIIFFETHVLFGDHDPNVKYDIYGQDKYTYFGDGRFQVMHWATDVQKLQLLDFYGGGFPSFYIIREIQRYILIDNILYISGDFSQGTTDLQTGDRVYYSLTSEAPQFMILDIDSGKAKYYLSLDEMSDEDRVIFEMNLKGEYCLKEKTCYQKSLTPPWWTFFLFWK